MHIAINALSADSYINTFVSAAFFNKGGKIVSIKGSMSLLFKFYRIEVIVNIAFLANYDLKESTSLISSFIT